jgi:putative MATE family efflux protein
VAIPTRLRPSSDPSEQEVKPQGDPGKILRLAIPVSLESVFQMGFNVIDQVIVGLLGADAVAAVGLSNSIASIALLLYASTGVGAGVMVARACGRKDLKEVSQIASAGQGLSGLLGLITAFLLVWFSQPLLWMVGADPKLAGSANGYFQLYAVSIAPMILSAVTSAVFRSLNAPRTPLIITSAAVALNTVLGFVLVHGFSPIPSFGVAGAGWATLISQCARCLALILFLYAGKKGVRWVWPLPGSRVGATAGKLLRLTGPIALSEVLWGMSTFIYAVVFTRLGTTKLAASQIVLSLESIFIVASAGLAAAAVAVIGHALGVGSPRAAKASAWLTIRFGLLAGVALGALYAGSSFLLPAFYPKVGQDVLQLAFWGVLLMAVTQPAKVLSSVLGNGVLASGGDTHFVLMGNLTATYAVGLPAAVGLGLLAPFGFFGVFAARSWRRASRQLAFCSGSCVLVGMSTPLRRSKAQKTKRSQGRTEGTNRRGLVQFKPDGKFQNFELFGETDTG